LEGVVEKYEKILKSNDGDDSKAYNTKDIDAYDPSLNKFLEEIWDDNHKNVNDPSLWCYGNNFDMHKSLWHRQDFADWEHLNLKGLNQYFVGAFSNG
jgi:hypothetical protein